MRVLYHLTIPRPNQPKLDAVVQEIDALHSRLGGELVYVNPARRPGSRFPERLYGMLHLPYLRRREVAIDLHHISNSHLYPFPYLRWLRKPIVYTVTAGLRVTLQPSQLERLARLARIVVSNERDRSTLQDQGLRNVEIVRSGIDVARFTRHPAPDTPGFTLLMASAPWTIEQFESKGIDALLETAQARPELRLVFLWRELHLEEVERRITRRELNDRVTVVNRRVDVNETLTQVHAAVVLAEDASLVKAYPHSLLEALAAGRPVLVSRAIPMAEFVDETRCGVVVEHVEARGVTAALDDLIADYRTVREAALRLNREIFSLDRLTQDYSRIFQGVIGDR